MTPILCVYFDGDQAVSQFVLGEVWQQYHISIDVSVQVSWNFISYGETIMSNIIRNDSD